jgi:hypothetical protein
VASERHGDGGGDGWYDEYLAEVGWQKQEFPHRDQRRVHQLGETRKLRRNVRGGYDGDDGVGGGGGGGGGGGNGGGDSSRSPGRTIDSTRRPVDTNDRNTTDQLDHSMPNHQVMEDGHPELEQRRRDRENSLNELGIFDASVNEVRARAMYRVEMRQRMHDNASNSRRNRYGKPENRAFDPAVYNRKDTLENRLLTLSADIDTIIGEGAEQRRREKARKSDSAAEDEVRRRAADNAAARAATRAAAATAPSEERTRRRQCNQRAGADAVARYRRAVEDRRADILGALGIDASLLEDPARLEQAVETLRAEAEVADKEAVDREAQRRRRAGDATASNTSAHLGGGGSSTRTSAPQPKETTMSLVSAAMERAARVGELLEADARGREERAAQTKAEEAAAEASRLGVKPFRTKGGKEKAERGGTKKERKEKTSSDDNEDEVPPGDKEANENKDASDEDEETRATEAAATEATGEAEREAAKVGVREAELEAKRTATAAATARIETAHAAQVAALAAADADADLAIGRAAAVHDTPPRLAPLGLPQDTPLAQVIQALN